MPKTTDPKALEPNPAAGLLVVGADLRAVERSAVQPVAPAELCGCPVPQHWWQGGICTEPRGHKNTHWRGKSSWHDSDVDKDDFDRWVERRQQEEQPMTDETHGAPVAPPPDALTTAKATMREWALAMERAYRNRMDGEPIGPTPTGPPLTYEQNSRVLAALQQGEQLRKALTLVFGPGETETPTEDTTEEEDGDSQRDVQPPDVASVSETADRPTVGSNRQTRDTAVAGYEGVPALREGIDP